MSFWASWNFLTIPRQASFRPFSAHHHVMYFTVTGVWAVARRATIGVAAAPARPVRNARRDGRLGMRSPPWLVAGMKISGSAARADRPRGDGQQLTGPLRGPASIRGDSTG